MSNKQSRTPLPAPERAAVARIDVMVHGKPEVIGDAEARLWRVAEGCGVTPPDRARPTWRSCSAATARCCGRCSAISARKYRRSG